MSSDAIDRGTTGGPPLMGLDVLRGTPGWQEALEKLRTAWDGSGELAIERARDIRTSFQGRRGQMVMDVVSSGFRRYKQSAKITSKWLRRVEHAGGAPSLAWLTAHPESYDDFGLRRVEPPAIAGVAGGLLRYAADHGFDDEDAACEAWATGAVGLELAHQLDPYVGSVTGVGPALLAYTRMLCGADTVKPDVRVLKQLRTFGVQIPPGDARAGFVAVVAMAAELGVRPVELDQFFWYRA